MSGNSKFINGFNNYRYFVTVVCNNVIFQATTFCAASSHTELTEVNLNYNELDKLLQTHLGLMSTPADIPPSAHQQLRNHRTTLNGFLASVGKTFESRVGVELTSRFDESLSRYIEKLDVAPSTKRDRRSHLNRYRALFAERDNLDKPKRKTTVLSEALRDAIAQKDIAPKTLAKSIGLSPSALQRYLAGAMPNKRGIPGLRRLEVELGFERDSLTALLKEEVQKGEKKPHAANKFQRRHASRVADVYFVHVSALSSEFEREWRHFLNYKTAVVPSLKRTTKGVWRCIPAETSSIKCRFAKVGGSVCPTADISLSRIRGLLGYLERPMEAGGQSIDLRSNQTLAWLAVPSATNGYLEFLTRRSDGLIHWGQGGFAQFVASLVRPETGYLRQSPDLRNALPEGFRPETISDWERLCDETYKSSQHWKKRAKDISRDPQAPIASLLALEAPLQPVVDAVSKINDLAARAPSGSVSQARHKRDALLIAFVTSNPLRLRSLQSLTWSDDETGSVYRTPTGWRVRLGRSMFKNGDSKAGERYDVAVAPYVGDMIEEYVGEYRSTLLGDLQSSYFFVGDIEGELWEEMGGHVAKLTKRHVAHTHGFCLHAFRHLVATDLLKRHPNQFLTAAVLLNDSLKTVMRSYAHLQRDDSFAVHHTYLESLSGKGARE